MTDYMDLVLVENLYADGRIVCKAPWMSHLEKGTKVFYEYEGKSYSGEVRATMDIAKDEKDDINFILECTKQEKYGLPKIISKMKVIDFDYEDEDEDDA